VNTTLAWDDREEYIQRLATDPLTPAMQSSTSRGPPLSRIVRCDSAACEAALLLVPQGSSATGLVRLTALPSWAQPAEGLCWGLHGASLGERVGSYEVALRTERSE
jgi:hypothetical protein